MPEPNKRVGGTGLNTVDISIDKVRKLLLTIDTSKSAGPDGMHPRVLKELAVHLAEPVTIICKKSLQEGTLPEQWKSANVTPLFKKGDKKQSKQLSSSECD